MVAARAEWATTVNESEGTKHEDSRIVRVFLPPTTVEAGSRAEPPTTEAR